MRVTVIGAGYVGLTSAAALAHVGHDVTCVETDPAKLAILHRRADPLGEPGLEALLGSKRLSFVAIDRELGAADAILVGVGTPPLPDGRPDTSQIDAAARTVAERARPNTPVLIRSTVPVGTCDRLQAGLLRDQLVVSNPEFLREGRAVQDTFAPDRMVAGGPEAAQPVVRELYEPLLEGRQIPPGLTASPRQTPLLWMDARSAELTKYAANAFLATKLSFANEIANLARLADADARAVLSAVALDPRIGGGHLQPSFGWGGGCLPKDARALQALADEYGYDFLVLRAAIERNDRQLAAFAHSIASQARPGGRIGLLGLAFKAGTSDTRESPAVRLADHLIALGLSVAAYDPMVTALPDGSPAVVISSSAVKACSGADVATVATEWPEFKTLDLSAIRAVMRGDALFDGRGVIDQGRARSAGFRYWGMGLPAPAARPTREASTAGATAR